MIELFHVKVSGFGTAFPEVFCGWAFNDSGFGALIFPIRD